MTVVRKDIIITLLLYLLTSQEKAYSDVLLKDKSENITCNVTEEKEKFVWYKYAGDFLFNYDTDNETFAPPSDGGIFTCDKGNADIRKKIAVNCTTQNIIIIPAITEETSVCFHMKTYAYGGAEEGSYTSTGALVSSNMAYSDVLLKDKSENITCNVTEEKEKFVWYKYAGDFLFNYDTDNETFAPPSDGGIFTCDKGNADIRKKIAVNCTTQNIIIIPAITGNFGDVPENITKSIGQNVSFQTQFYENIAYILLWVVKQQNVSKCMYSVTRSITDFKMSLNPLCCSSDAIRDEERIKFRNLTAIHERNQTVYLDLVNLTSSDSGEYTCIKLSCEQAKWKWNILSKYSLEVTGGEESLRYIIAGSIGGFIAVVAGLLLTILCIKNRGKQKSLNRSSPAGVPDDYECMPYAVTERKEMSNNMYSLAQNPAPTTDAEYCEVQLTNLALPSAHASESAMKANIVPDAEYAEVTKKKPPNENDACHAYSVVNINKK